jgi:putative transposase
MPRQARLDAPGVLQHVMARGIERRKIFWDDKDRSSFLDRLALILEETQTQCYAWALIPNHFHILLRTAAAPLSKVMRRLMTGYAVTFNIRHRRSGHLFQNRYKSVVCEEETYLLELTRYIHLNPLRARLVEDLKSLDKYPWSGHSALMGKQKNPLVPEIPPVIEGNRHLAEKTAEDVLQYFGKNLKEARRRYRVFVEKGIKHGRRKDLQGGGLIRSSGGDIESLIGQKKGEREKSDQRILGSGGFVSGVLKNANEIAERKANCNISLAELIRRVCKKFDIKTRELMLDIRRPPYNQARAIISYFSIHELGCRGSDVAKALNVSRASVSKAMSRGEKLIDTKECLWDLLKAS